MDISELIKQIEEIYNKFMISDNTPDMEADLKIKLLDAISSTLAFCNLRKGPNSENLKVILDNLKEKLLVWDPYGPWFKENKELSKGTYDVITLAKTIKFEEAVTPLNIVKTEDFNAFKNTIQKELQILRNEIILIKDLINKIKPMKPTNTGIPTLAPKPIEVPRTTPVPIPKPVSVAQPIPVAKPVPIPKPVAVHKPSEIPTSVPLTDLPPSSTTEEKDSSKLF
ncbi:MAG: hypothetical protein HWN67_10360, partial [Candidatus Helarchaeota archaeon]|nr:hypothetical protein [Candidatus Helarchaeota archaeon]